MYSPPRISSLTVHWRLDDLRIHARLVSTGTPGGWLGLGFPVIANRMIGATAIIGSSTEGVKVYSLDDKLVDLVNPLARVWQTLTDTSFVEADGVTMLTFSKLLSEDKPEQPAEQAEILPHQDPTHLIFAAGSTADIAPHGVNKDAATLWLGQFDSTPPPTPPPSPPPSPPSPPPSPKPPLPLPPSTPPVPPPSECVGPNVTISSLGPDYACQVSPIYGMTMQ